MPTRKKWKPFNFHDAGNTDDSLTSDSTPTRTASNPIYSARHSLPAVQDRRIVSDTRTHSNYLDKPLRAAELQKLHESQEQQARDKTSPVDRPSGETTDSTSLSASLTFSNSQQPLEPTLTTTTNCHSAAAEAKPLSEPDEVNPDRKLYFRDRLDSAWPSSNENILAQVQCSSSSPEREPELVTIGTRPGDDMANAPVRVSGRPNRFENRPPMSTILCRNGPQCRKLQEGTCHYNHDFTSMAPNGLNASVHIGLLPSKLTTLKNNSSKRSLNVDSPSFTPTAKNATPIPAAKIGISPKAAAAATFTPRGSGSVTPATGSHSKEPSAEFIPQQVFQQAQQFQEFVPGQSFLTSPQMDAQQPQVSQQINAFDNTFLSQQNITTLDASQTQINPYVQQAHSVGNTAFFQDPSSYKHPLSYHLYASIGPRRENLMAYQRSTADFFIPDDLREDLQRKSEATLQTYANSALPSVEHFHSLVALDTNHTRGASTFGYQTWVYKATSSKDGHTYALRRIEGFRLSNPAAIRAIDSWKRITNASLVRIHETFTGKWFGDSSLIIVTDYHPRSQTLAEKHFAVGRHPHRGGAQVTPEHDLWGYIVQIASALKTIHESGVAAQTVLPSKVLLTSKNRLRLNGCGVFDIVQYEQHRSLPELQRADLQDLGRLILAVAARNPTAHQTTAKSLELISRSYTERLRSCIEWLLTPPPVQQDPTQSTEPAVASTAYNIHTFLNSIADKVVATFDSTLHMEDELTSDLMRELENGRLARLLTKLNVILERPDTGSSPNANTPAGLNQPSAAWSETGERYFLKLFRDYVFHQVDQDGRPVLDLGHMIACLNKLDAGIDEKIQLVSRDEQSCFIVSYKEVKRGFEAAWAEISKVSNPSRR